MALRPLMPIALCASIVLGSAGCNGNAIVQRQQEQGSQQQAQQQPIRALQGLNIWLLGTHPMAYNPSQQIMAYHLCEQLTPDLMQCALFDSNQPNAKLTGIEYIISGERYDQLPPEEKQFWHPHNFEILSGALLAPNVSDDMKLFAGKLNSYGKTFHLWMTGRVAGETEDFPYGPPMLGWSLNKEGQLAPELKNIYQQMGYNLDALQKKRANYVDRAHPQCGIDVLDGQFQGPSSPIPGIEAKEYGCPEYPFPFKATTQ